MHPKTKKLLTDTLLTPVEAAERFNVPAATIKQWYYRGKIDGLIKGRTLMLDIRDLTEHLHSEPDMDTEHL